MGYNHSKGRIGISHWRLSMEQEHFKIFDEDRKEIGVASREDVHKYGYWHETFHCWFVTKIEGKDYLYLQLRSEQKKDYPNLLDITAAGHLLANESVEDGVREIKEEIGIAVSFEELISLGILNYSVVDGELIDKEFANVFLYKSKNRLGDFTLQVEEVAGLILVEFKEFSELWFDKRNMINLRGFRIDKEGNKVKIEEKVGKEQFVPHENSFYQEVVERIQERLN